MKFGRNVWYNNRPLEKIFEKTSNLGFDYIELSLDFPWPEGFTEKEIRLLENLKEEFGLELAFHGPWAGKQPAHPRDEISRASLEIYKKTLKFAEKFSPLYLNFHQYVEVATDKLEEIQKLILKKFFNSTKEILSFAKFPVTIENMPNLWFGLPSQFKSLLEIENFNLCLDVGHAAIVKCFQEKEFKSSRKEKFELKDWIENFKDKILVVHLHDCLIEEEKEPIDHIPIGEGSLNFEEISASIKKTNCKYILLEIFRLKNFKPITEKALKESLEICRSWFR